MKKKILLQIDHDEHPSAFDSIVAIDAGVEHLLTYANVTPIDIESLIHGCIFTRGSSDLSSTAIYFGGSDVGKSVELFTQAKKCFFGPLRVSLMADPNGSNTTAAAAVLSARRHIELQGKRVIVLAATGPVGQRICRLVSAAGANVVVASRSLSRAERICQAIESSASRELIPVEVSTPTAAAEMANPCDVVFAAGAASVELLADSWLTQATNVRVAIDVNAVAPTGIAGIAATDSAEVRHETICYGAIGVGQLKMQIHKECLRRLYQSNTLELDTDQIYAIGNEIAASP